MTEALVHLATFWLGAVHAITPGHGKTIAAAYIVGARGRPVDALILGIFVTLSHTSGIVLVGVLASLGLPGVVPQRIEAWMKLVTGLLVILIGLWTLWTQRELFAAAAGLRARTPAAGSLRTAQLQPTHGSGHVHCRPRRMTTAHDHDHHGHDHDHDHDHDHAARGAGYHSHGWGFKHTHNVIWSRAGRPSLWMLIWLGVAGGLLPDPAGAGDPARALAQGKVMLGLGDGAGVQRRLRRDAWSWWAWSRPWSGSASSTGWPGPWAARLQIVTSLVIVVVGVVLTVMALEQMA